MVKQSYGLKKLASGYYGCKLPSDKSYLSTGEKSKRRAEKIALERLEEYESGIDRTLTFGHYAKDFFLPEKCPYLIDLENKKRPIQSDTARWRRGHVKNYLLPLLGDTKLKDLKKSSIDAQIATLTQLSSTTKNNIQRTLSMILKYAVADRKINHNPMDEVVFYSRDGQKRDAFTRDEINKLFPNDIEELIRIWGTAEMAGFFMTVAFTGMRTGEARVLTWADLDNGFLEIDKALKNSGNIGVPKGKKPRSALLADRLRSFLDTWVSNEEKSIFPSLMTGKQNRNRYLKAFRKALEYVGIEKEGRCLVPHSLRHTANTLLVLEFDNDNAVREMIGHGTAEMTRLYLHNTKETRRAKLAPHRDTVNKLFPA